MQRTAGKGMWREWLRSGAQPPAAPAAAPAQDVAGPHEVQAIALDLLRDYEAAGKGWFWATDAQGRITYLSQCLARQLGIDHADLLGRQFCDLFDIGGSGADTGGERTLPLLMRGHKTFTELALRAEAGGGAAGGGGREFWFALSGRPQHDEVGQFTGFHGNGSDITAARQSQLDASRLAQYDGLTGLANRHRMARQLQQQFKALQTSRRAFALLMLDLDRFKAVNDTLGHPAGDDLLRQVAGRIGEVLDKGCEAGRLGGDEFQVLLPFEDRGRLGECAQQIIERLSEPFTVLGSQCAIGASIGIAVAPHDGEDPESLVRSADLALYASKEAGRGRFRFYSSDLHVEAMRRRRIEEDLRDALARGEISLVYQPQVSEAGQVTALGAVMRWTHPEIGDVPASAFLPIAEKSNLSGLLGDWAILRACEDAVQWSGNVGVAVKVTEAQVRNPGFAPLVTRALARSELAPGRLELEFPESVLPKLGQPVGDTLATLKMLGVRLVIDRFGTGRASLVHLRRSPFDKLKIAAELFPELTAPDGQDAAIVAALTTLSRAFALEIAVDGVTAQDQLDLLRQLKIGTIEGTIYSQPLDAAAVLAAMNAGEWKLRPSGPTRFRDDRRTMLRKVGLIHDDWRYDVWMRNLSRTGCMIEGLSEVPIGTQFVIDFGDGQFAVAHVRRAASAMLGLEFEIPLVDDGAGGLVTRTRISAAALAEAGLASRPGKGTPQFTQVADIFRRTGNAAASEG